MEVEKGKQVDKILPRTEELAISAFEAGATRVAVCDDARGHPLKTFDRKFREGGVRKIMSVEVRPFTIDDLPVRGLAMNFNLDYYSGHIIGTAGGSPFILPELDWYTNTAWLHPHMMPNGRACTHGMSRDVWKSLKADGLALALQAFIANMLMIKKKYLTRSGWHWLHYKNAVEGDEDRQKYGLAWLITRGVDARANLEAMFTREALEQARSTLIEYQNEGVHSSFYMFTNTLARENVLASVDSSLARMDGAEDRWAPIRERSVVWHR